VLRSACVIVALLPLLAGNLAAAHLTTIETEGSGTATMPADRLFLEVQFGARGDAPQSTVPLESDLALVRQRLKDAGIPATAIVESAITAVAAKYKNGFVDERPYGVVLLRFDRPAPALLDTLRNHTLLGPFTEPLREGIYVETAGWWYALNNCASIDAQARRAAVATARMAADALARAAKLSIAANTAPTVHELHDRFALSMNDPYLCRPKTLPDVPPPQIRTLMEASDFPGRFVAQSDVRAAWSAQEPRSGGVTSLPPPTLTSIHAPSASQTSPPEVGTIRSSVAVADEDVSPSTRSDGASAVPIAIALARNHAQWLGSDVGLRPTAIARLFDPKLYGLPPSPPRFFYRPTTALIVTFRAEGPRGIPGATLLSSGTAEVRLPPDRARVTISVQSGNDLSSVKTQIVDALVSAGIARSSVEVGEYAVEADVHVPTAAAMERIGGAIAAVSSRTNQRLNPIAVYAVDDCDTGDKMSLAAAVADARSAVASAARERNATLGPIVAAADVGTPPEEFCGPDVLATAHYSPLAPPGTLTDPVVIARANVQLLYGITPRTNDH